LQNATVYNLLRYFLPRNDHGFVFLQVYFCDAVKT